MKNNYFDLEMQISRFSQELPKVERQIEMLENLANTIQRKECPGGWDPKTHLPLPNVDVFLKKPIPIKQE